MKEEVAKLIKEKIEMMYNSLMERPFKVLDIFNDFFGEENVDMQGYWDLNTFECWIKEEPISTYIPDYRTTSMAPEDWDKYNTYSINILPENFAIQIANILNSHTILDKVWNSTYWNIFIIVHFPHVRVTNEHNRFVDINHLWAKICISYNGTMEGEFSLNRSEYTISHLRSDYMHSHVSGIPTRDFSQFQSPCTGQGPIRDTINSLNINYDEDIWNMFCLELSKYVTVESVAGVPYHYLERIGTDDMIEGIGKFTAYISNGYHAGIISKTDLKEFVKYFVNLKELKFNYVNGSFSIGMSFIEFIVLISNEFIKWYNDQFNKNNVTATFDMLKRCGLVRECIIANGKIYYEDSTRIINNYTQYIGKKVCVFKGKDITVNITDITDIRNDNKSLILDTRTALYILTRILKVLNYRYGRNKAIYKDDKIGTEVRYL